MATESKTDRLRAIKDEVVNFKESPLYDDRIKANAFPVLGEGSHDANIMFIGEAPGKNEAATGRPFCGASGRILDELLESVGIPREDVYVTNIVKDRPPGNRDPSEEEIAAYAPFLNRQIDVIQPKVIATLGRFSMIYIMELFGLASKCGPISEMHGKSFEAEASYGKIHIIPLYHPAVVVYNNNMKDELKKDFITLKQFI